jgi:MATE family multidrug resistance protein
VYVIAMAACFTLRFRSGKWKTMRVIESKVPDEEIATG